MRIGIDVDGVLTDLEKYQLTYGKKYFKDCKNIDETQIDIEKIFNCTREEREKFWIKYIWKYCLQEPARDNAVVAIQELKKQGNQIFIITSRAHSTENSIVGELFRKMLLIWLEKMNIPYDGITFCSEKNSEIDKYEACKKYGIDVMIEDKRENIVKLSEITKVICFDAKYNQNCEGPNIIRVSNYNQIYDEIQKLQNPHYFKKLNHEELSKMSISEKKEYYKQMRQYYMNLPYDNEKHSQNEKNYAKLCKVAIPAFNAIFKPHVFNRKNIPLENGVLYVANHNNYFDQFPIIAAIGDSRPIHFLTATKMLKLKRGYFYLKTGAISVDRESKTDREKSSEEIKKILINGGNAFIFPEGRTNRNEDFLLDFQPGAVAIARDIGCKIVPIAVNDNYKKEKGELCVRFGESFYVSEEDDVIEKTKFLKETIGQLKQENIDYVESKKEYVKNKMNPLSRTK